MTKKLSLLFFICILSALNINAEVIEGSCGANVRYSLDTSTGLLSITGTGAMTNYSYSSSAPWNSKQSYVKTVEISNGVTSIGNYAFFGCSGLTSVTIPNSVTSIGENAFSGCSGLTSVTIPNSVTSIGNYAFINCSKLTSISVENGNEKYDSRDNCNAIIETASNTLIVGCNNTIIPNSVTNIGGGAFSGCSGLTSIIIPNSVTDIGVWAFSDCSGLTSVTIPNSVTSIGDFAFSGCSGLTSVTIPNSVTSIGSCAFYNCSGLTSITIPNSITSIGGSVFWGCSGLTSVTIPSSVTSIDDYAFYECSGLTSIHITDIAAWCKIKFSLYYSNPLYYAQHLFMNGKEITDLVIPNSVTSIGDYAFDGCSGLTSITIPNSVTSIGSGAFSGCSGITSITIPNNVTSIGGGAFSGCSGLTTVTLNSNTIISSSNFSMDNIFGGFKKEFIIGNNVTSIGKNTFSGCSGLTSVTIPNSVTSIGDFAFSGCSGLTSVTIPNSVTSIGDFAFSGCSGLTSVTIPNSVTSIGNRAFGWCTGLKEVHCNAEKVPNTSTDAFLHVNLADAILYTPIASATSYIMVEPWSKFNAICSTGSCGENVNYTLNFSTGILNITGTGAMNNPAWYSQTSYIKSIEISNEVTSIGEYAFWGCTSLKTLIIGSGVKWMGTNVYGNEKITTKPTKVIWLSNTPPENYKFAEGTVNYVSNNNYTDLSNKTVYPFLSSMFEVDGIRYVPVSPSERTCDAIDCVYNESAEKINIGEKVTNKGISLTVKQVCPYTCYGNTFIKDVNLGFAGDLRNNAFYGCTSLNTATISNQGYIGNNAFYGCTSLNTATISNQGYIGESAFDGCTNLNTVTINNKGDIGKNAFRECSSITKIDLGNGVTSIGSSAFYRCSKLSSITIPDAVTSIGIYAFNDCSALNSIKIGSGVKSIGYYAFWNCAALEKIQIPQSVTSIDNYVFKGCTGLNTVIIDNGNSELSMSSNGSSPLFADCPLDSVYIGRNITYNASSDKGYSPFYRNTSLRTVVITDKETEISDNEFYGCTNLQSFKVGDGVTKFGNYAFSGCSSLKSLSFGTKLQSIGQEAFSDCNAVIAIVSKATTPPVCGSQALDDISKWDCVLYVPEGTISTYQAADQWKEFFFIEEGDPFAVLRGDANGDGKVDMDDATFVTNIILGTEEATEAADVNNDGQVSMPDAMFIVNKILNGKFPDGE